ncbi:hemerythrin domain-containing protein [Nonomuraea spiralis]|uniref:Hemerythrin domain-containing protein n=1 Tax=Nonomuraea spiralis TaxID=46182 RepID=A0ABV5IUE1_9ACTN|nr:hemerythrin domain-containing protein [Nonomuraea spiralis]GGS90799.1 hemerythrin [Nonomuraea spiralis]
MEERQDLIDVLISDHREIERMFTELEGMTGRLDERPQELAEEVLIELVRHSVTEEEYLYPAVREHVPGGDAAADRQLAGHAETERTIRRLEGLEPGDAAYWTTLEELRGQVRHHVDEAETDIFPLVRESCPRERLLELGAEAVRARHATPDQSHPTTSGTPGSSGTPWAGLVDRVRRALTGHA